MIIMNAGYKITDHISVEGKNYALGHNPSELAPYVVWETDAEMSGFIRGHYFAHKDKAIADMIKRATYNLERADGTPLSVDFLEENARAVVEEEYRHQNAMESIQAALYETLTYDIPNENLVTAEDLLKDVEFATMARRAYFNLDHSGENDSLREALEDILTEHPKFLEKEIPADLEVAEPVTLRAEVKIPPELNALINDLLSIPSAAAYEKYGPLGDNITFEFPFENGYKAVLELMPSYQPNSDVLLSKSKAHYILFSAFDDKGEKFLSHDYHAGDFKHLGMDYKPMTGTWKAHHYPLTLEAELTEDPALRRVGNSFVFHAVGDDPRWNRHDGETCKILRTLDPHECDILSSGIMYEAEFPNGGRLNIFDNELEGPVQELSLKPPLSQQISSAQERVSAAPAPGQERKAPEL